MTQLSFEGAVAQWQKVKREIATLVEQEQALRLSIFAAAFPAPKEGVNKLTMADGAIISANYPINRKIDKDGLIALEPQLVAKGIDIRSGDLIDWKPSLSVSAYKKLPPDAAKILNRVITSKPGTPSLTVT